MRIKIVLYTVLYWVLAGLAVLPGCQHYTFSKSSSLKKKNVDKREKNSTLSVSGISQRDATSFLLSELGPDYVDIPLLLDGFEFKKADSNNRVQSIDRSIDSLSDSLLDSTNNILAGQSITFDSQLSYQTHKAFSDVIDYYKCHMERLGWQLSIDFYAQEALLFFVKPDKRSAISIRPHKKIIQVTIFISNFISSYVNCVN